MSCLPGRLAVTVLLLVAVVPHAPLLAQRAAAGKNAAAEAKAKEPEPEIPALGKAATETLVHAFTQAESWSLKAITLFSLGKDWHPVAVPIVLACLRDKDERLAAAALELLRRMDATSVQQVALPELVGELIGKQLKKKNVLFAARLLETLGKMVPAANAQDRKGYEEWWRANEKTWAPKAWEAPPDAKAEGNGKGTVVAQTVERAFDLRDSGLDVAIVMDSTGSMQMVIDTARDAIDDVTALLASIAPKMRLGLVHYKDLEDMTDGADVLVPMNKNQKEVRDSLGRLVASGGGDLPERIEKGIEKALSKEMGWNKDANRLILVIGDAPPHADAEAGLLEMVKRAHDAPFQDQGKPKGKPTTGPKPKETYRPFITSTIATNPEVKKSFDPIAAAGGGTSVAIEPIKKVDGKPVAGQGLSAVQQVVEQIMLLSFGPEHRAQLRAFVTTYFEYRDAGLFK
ncbi:MAG: VWA domain-containing protein [Planctomycetes bacterium]|nr:VWA domain-containing protein [Planctomycetota bacterium]